MCNLRDARGRQVEQTLESRSSGGGPQPCRTKTTGRIRHSIHPHQVHGVIIKCPECSRTRSLLRNDAQANNEPGEEYASNSLFEMVQHAGRGTPHTPSYRSPKNAITLQSDLNDAFGAMRIYFEHVRGDTYRVHAWKDDPYPYMVSTITFKRHGPSTAELPSQDLLGLHCTLGRILHMNGAAENFDVLLRQLEGKEVDPDGGTSLGVMVGALLGREGIPVD